VAWDAWASLETLKETAAAMVFLHDHHIIHGDLKVGGDHISCLRAAPITFTLQRLEA
jgi:serine/threonine protein kinase